MTASDQQIEKLDDRVTRLEEAYRADIITLHAKIDGLTTLLNQSLVANAKQACPSPGACIVLSEKLTAQVSAHNATMLRVERLELQIIEQGLERKELITRQNATEEFTKQDARIKELEKWQGRLIGAFSLMMIALTIFGPTLRKFFKLE